MLQVFKLNFIKLNFVHHKIYYLNVHFDEFVKICPPYFMWYITIISIKI